MTGKRGVKVAIQGWGAIEIDTFFWEWEWSVQVRKNR